MIRKKAIIAGASVAIAAFGVLAMSGAARAAAINFDIDRDGNNTYSGVGVAPDTGTTWNSVPVTQNGTGYVIIGDSLDSQGNSTGVSLSVDRDGGGTMKIFDSTANNPIPSDLMRDYGYWSGWTAALSGLNAGAYDVYVYGVNNDANSGSTWTLDASNGGASGTMTGASRDVFSSGAEGVSYVKLAATVDGSGALTFSGGDNFNGFQIISAVPEPASLGLLGLCAGGLVWGRRRCYSVHLRR